MTSRTIPLLPLTLEQVRFDYRDIQELWVSPDKLTLVRYKDRKWLLGVDKEFEFYLGKGNPFADAYAMLKGKLDRRSVAAVADPQPDLLWELPVKLLGILEGSEGVPQGWTGTDCVGPSVRAAREEMAKSVGK